MNASVTPDGSTLRWRFLHGLDACRALGVDVDLSASSCVRPDLATIQPLAEAVEATCRTMALPAVAVNRLSFGPAAPWWAVVLHDDQDGVTYAFAVERDPQDGRIDVGLTEDLILGRSLLVRMGRDGQTVGVAGSQVIADPSMRDSLQALVTAVQQEDVLRRAFVAWERAQIMVDVALDGALAGSMVRARL